MIPDDAIGTRSSRLVLSAALGVLAFASALAALEPSVGLSSVRVRRFENEALPPYLPQQEDRFAFAFAVGIPKEDEDDVLDVGAEVVLYGALFADGFESGTVFWS